MKDSLAILIICIVVLIFLAFVIPFSYNWYHLGHGLNIQEYCMALGKQIMFDNMDPLTAENDNGPNVTEGMAADANNYNAMCLHHSHH